MNRWTLASGLLAAFTAMVHVFAGGQTVATPLLAASFDETAQLTMYACWHIVSVTLTTSAVALLWSALPGNSARAQLLIGFVSLLWIGSGLVFVAVALTRPEGGWLFQLPQWTLLIPVGTLGLVGAMLTRG